MHGMVNGEYTLLQSSGAKRAVLLFYWLMAVAIVLNILSWLWFRNLSLGKIKYLAQLSSALFVGYGIWAIAPKYMA